MFKKKTMLTAKAAVDQQMILTQTALFNNYKRKLNKWIVGKKEGIFNLETNEIEYFLIITPVREDQIIKIFWPTDGYIETYKVTEELYNKIQVGDIIKVIVDKGVKDDEKTEA